MLQIYHYSKCSTSKNALQILKNKRLSPQIILYCENNYLINKDEILNLIKFLKLTKPIDLVKKNGLTYKNLKLSKQNLSDEEWIDVIIKNPKLLKRPILIYKEEAIIANKEGVIEFFLKENNLI